MLLPERVSYNKNNSAAKVFLLWAELLDQSFPGSEQQAREHSSSIAPPLDERHSVQESTAWQEYYYTQGFTMDTPATNSYFRRWNGEILTQPYPWDTAKRHKPRKQKTGNLLSAQASCQNWLHQLHCCIANSATWSQLKCFCQNIACEF